MGNIAFAITMSYTKTFFYEIKNLTKDKKILEIKDITTRLVDFLMSDTFMYFCLMFEGYDKKKISIKCDYLIFATLFFICDYFEKFLSIKCLFPLIEELKKSKFENQINKLIKLLNNPKERDDFKNNFVHPPNFEYEEINNILKDEINVQYYEFSSKIAKFLIDWLILGKQKITKVELIE